MFNDKMHFTSSPHSTLEFWNDFENVTTSNKSQPPTTNNIDHLHLQSTLTLSAVNSIAKPLASQLLLNCNDSNTNIRKIYESNNPKKSVLANLAYSMLNLNIYL